MHKIWRIAVFALVVGLANCGKFQTINYGGGNTDLVYEVNDTANIASVSGIAIPSPLPLLPRGAPETAPLPFTGNPRAAVPSQVSGPVRKPAIADGVVGLSDITASPYYRVGRLSFNLPSDKPGYFNTCTAQLVGSQGVIITAGHCIYDGGWATNLLFSPRL